MNNTIHQWVHGRGKGSNQHIGVLLATKLADNSVLITGSKANISKGDKFSRKIGMELAENRCSSVIKGRTNTIANSMGNALDKFESRCKRYFKNSTIVKPTLKGC